MKYRREGKLMYIDQLGVASGVIVLLIGLSLISLMYSRYKVLDSPAKQLGRRILLSLIFFSAGGIGVIADSLNRAQLWFLAAIPITISYILAVSAGVHYIRRITCISNSHQEKMDEKWPLYGGYITRKSAKDIRELLMLLKENSKELVVIGRDPEDAFVRSSGVKPDRYIWLSRTGSLNSVDPAKLHMLQEEILRFAAGKGGRIVVYLGGLDYLLLYNDFKSVAKFLLNLKDHLMMKASLLIIHLPEQTVDKLQESTLMREFEWLDEGRMLSEIEEIALFGIMRREGPPNAGSTNSQGKSGDD